MSAPTNSADLKGNSEDLGKDSEDLGKVKISGEVNCAPVNGKRKSIKLEGAIFSAHSKNKKTLFGSKINITLIPDDSENPTLKNIKGEQFKETIGKTGDSYMNGSQDADGNDVEFTITQVEKIK